MRGQNNSIPFFLLLVVYWTITTSTSCSPTRRSGENNPSDSGADAGTDAGDSETPWDSDTSTDFDVMQPVFLSEFAARMAASFDGSHVAVSFSGIDVSEPYTTDDPSTVFFVFPWNSPEDVMFGSFTEDIPGCLGPYTQNMASSKPHPHPDGFLLLTAPPAGSGNDCETVQTLWDHDANLIEGPYLFTGLFPDNLVTSMDPHGLADSEGYVVTGTMNSVGFNEADPTDTEGTIVLDIDRWNASGFHERVRHALFPWPFDSAEVMEQQIRSGFIDQAIYLHDNVYTVLSQQDKVLEGNTKNESTAVISRVDTEGFVVQGPSLLVEDGPPVPPGFEYTTYDQSLYSFSSNSDSILELAKTMYMDLEGYSTYDPSIADPFPVLLWSRMIDFDGTPLTGWTELAEFESYVRYSYVFSEWSGAYFGACYSEPFDTYKLIVMDENGLPVIAPINLFWDIPPIENSNRPCDVVAIDEDTFVVVLGVPSDPPQAYAGGLWATRVDVNIPIE